MSVRATHEWTDDTGEKRQRTCRRVIRVTERTIDKKGQLLLEPDITLEGRCNRTSATNRSKTRRAV